MDRWVFDRLEDLKKMRTPAWDSPEGTILALHKSQLFDAVWYLQQYPDVAASGFDPAEHYVLNGWKENREPAPWFCGAFYTRKYKDVASSGINPFCHYIYSGYAEKRVPADLNREGRRLAKEAAALASKGKVQDALAQYDLAMAEAESLDFVLSCLMAQGDCLMNSGQLHEAVKKYVQARTIFPQSAPNLAALGRCLLRQSQWRQAIEAYEKAIALDERHAWWHANLGIALEKMYRWGAAVAAYEKALELDGSIPEWHYRLGYAFEHSGLYRQAQDAYQKAIDLDTTLGAKTLGIGVFHAKHGHLVTAIAAWKKKLQSEPENVKVYARLAESWLQAGELEKAIDAGMTVLSLASPASKGLVSIRWRTCFVVGLAMERSGRFVEAADIYTEALSMRHDRRLVYRRGYALYSLGHYEEACDAWKELGIYLDSSLREGKQKSAADNKKPSNDLPSWGRMLKNMARNRAESCLSRLKLDVVDPALHFQAGLCLEQAERMEEAAHAYAASAARQSEHVPATWYRLGRVLASLGRYGEACQAYIQSQILGRPCGLASNPYEKMPRLLLRAVWLEFSETLPLAPRTILYENLEGISVGDSPHALFLHMLQDTAWAAYTHVWVLENMADIPEELKGLPNVIFTRRETIGYLRYLATAGIIINNVTFPIYFSRREGQIYLNTWHGIPLKTLGRMDQGSKWIFYNVSRNFLHATHMIHPNKFTEQSVLDNGYAPPLMLSGMVRVTGYPRMDVSLNLSDDKKIALKKRLGIPSGKKVLLYAPTWRGNFARQDNLDTNSDFMRDVLAACKSLSSDYVTLFRGHQIFMRNCGEMPDCIMAPQAIASNEIVALADALITDYSSIMFDFLGMKKPVILYCHDLEQYARERGFYLDPHKLPFALCRNISELKIELNRLKKWTPDPDYMRLFQELCDHDDGNSSRRVCDFLKEGNTKKQDDRKYRILFYATRIPNGISSSFIALCNLLAQSRKYDICVAVESDSASNNNIVYDDIFSELDSRCTVFPVSISPNMTPEERDIYEIYNRNDDWPLDSRLVLVLKKIYIREYRRLFSDYKFDAMIDFAGYSRMRAEFFAFANEECQKLIYLHNDMRNESLVRFPYLKRIFPIYRHFDKLVSVSQAVSDENKSNLAAIYDVPDEKFVFCPNVQRPEYVRKAASEPLLEEDFNYFADKGRVFINVARLSPEKNQKMLIRAFALIHSRYPATRLLIVGHGPTETELREFIASMGLSDSVRLAGFRANPHALTNRAHCFVLPSIHEGQPVVLFEAMALRKPIVATDIATNREVLGNGKYGRLTENTPEAFAAGMEAFLRGEIAASDFDFDSYQRQALSSFEALLKYGHRSEI